MKCDGPQGVWLVSVNVKNIFLFLVIQLIRIGSRAVKQPDLIYQAFKSLAS